MTGTDPPPKKPHIVASNALGQPRWTSKLGVVLAVAGSAVGLGNFLRFPGQVAANGGGAFMIPYFVALILVGIPLGWAEWTMGRRAGRRGLHSAPAVFGQLGRQRGWAYLGALGIVIPMIVSFYYSFVEAWCLHYTWHYLTGGLGIDPSAPITEQTAAAANLHAAVSGTHAHGELWSLSNGTLVAWLVAFTLNVVFVTRGLSRGIEKVCLYAMPAMAVCALIVLVRVLTLGTPDADHPERSVVNGLGFMWNPDFSALANPQTWLRAAGQIFFSLSLGFGVIINYASYLQSKDDVVLSGLTASSTNELFEVTFGGLITVTAAFVFLGASGAAAAVATGSFGLGFTTLPVVFAQMGSYGNWIGAVWFFMLFLAALTSSLSMYQPVVAFFQEAFDWSRERAALLMVVCCSAGSLSVMYWTRGGAFWGTLDEWVGTFLVFSLAAIEILLFGWVLGVDEGLTDAHVGAKIRIPRWYRPVIKYVAPAFLLLVFAAFCWVNLPNWAHDIVADPLRRAAAMVILGVLGGVLLVIHLSHKRLVPPPRNSEGEALP